MGELSSSHSVMSARVRHFLRLVPPPAGVHFSAYMLGMMSSPPVVEVLGLTDSDQQLLVELAYQTFTEEHFLSTLRYLRL